MREVRRMIGMKIDMKDKEWMRGYKGIGMVGMVNEMEWMIKDGGWKVVK